MGEGLGRPLISYLDTQIAVWLAETNLRRITRKALRQLETSAVMISPMALLEVQYLFEIKRIDLPARDVETKLVYELGVRVCDLDFGTVVTTALQENWTRDPFDRIIAAHAKTNNFAYLISSDEKIAQHYPRTIW